MVFEITTEGWIIAFVSVGLMLMSALVRRKILGVEKIKEMRERMKQCQKEVKEATKNRDTKRVQKAQEELMKLSIENMKYMYSPKMLIYTMLPFFIVFTLLANMYGDLHPALNVVIIDSLPLNISYIEVNTSKNGFYNSTTKTIRWDIERVSTDTTEKVSVNLTVDPNYLEILNKSIENSITTLEYTQKDGFKELITLNDINDQKEGVIMSLKKMKSNSTAANKVSYEVIYRNTALHNVVKFPLKTDFMGLHINNGFGWLMWYLVTAMVFSIFINKLLKVS